jgi:3-demethoxyubiquinol 3-hydroxylase
MRSYTWQDQWIFRAETLLRTFVHPSSFKARPYPAEHLPQAVLTPKEKCHAAALMRVNHTGEICAQALYQGQALASTDTILRNAFYQSAQEERDHLAWCKRRVHELEGHLSYLNPFWYLGALIIGLCAGLAGKAYSLGFLAETEAQVYQHLNRHLVALPEADLPSRCIVTQMQLEESEHQKMAEQLGATPLPRFIQQLMYLCSKCMVNLAYYI